MVAMVLIVATTTFVHAQPRPDELPSFRFGGGLVDMGVNVGPYRLLEPSTSVGFDLRMRWPSPATLGDLSAFQPYFLLGPTFVMADPEDRLGEHADHVGHRRTPARRQRTRSSGISSSSTSARPSAAVVSAGSRERRRPGVLSRLAPRPRPRGRPRDGRAARRSGPPASSRPRRRISR